jgi:hypothetical protein
LTPISLPLFLRKLQDKHQSEPQQKQAQHAVSLFYEMQTAPVRRPINIEPTSGVSVAKNDPIKSTSSQPYKPNQVDVSRRIGD